MKSIRFLSVVAVVASFASASAFAADAGKWEVVAGSAGSFNIQLTSPQGTSFAVIGGLAYDLGSGLEVGLYMPSTGFKWDNGSATVTFPIEAGITFNFMSDYRDAIYIDGRAGASISTTSAFIYQFDLGKRFKLSDSVSWNPAIAAVGNQAQATLSLDIIPLQFSFFL